VSDTIRTADGVALAGSIRCAADLERSIEQALVGNAKVDAESLSVLMWNDGTVSLSGTVGSWAAHDAAIVAALAVPGATAIDDHIRVEG
jgi:osmotically-inducible protein OsmY